MTFKRSLTTGLAFLGISFLPSYGQKAPSSAQEQERMNNVAITGMETRSQLKREGRLLGMDKDGNATYFSGLCISDSGRPNSVATSFVPKNVCDKLPRPAYVEIYEGERISEPGPAVIENSAWRRIGRACMAREGTTQTNYSWSICVESAITKAQLGPNGTVSGSSKQQRTK